MPATGQPPGHTAGQSMDGGSGRQKKGVQPVGKVSAQKFLGSSCTYTLPVITVLYEVVNIKSISCFVCWRIPSGSCSVYLKCVVCFLLSEIWYTYVESPICSSNPCRAVRSQSPAYSQSSFLFVRFLGNETILVKDTFPNHYVAPGL